MTASALLQRVALPASPAPWPTLDPFLFCVHHHDAYPAGDGALAPAAPLDGRSLGADFSARDGWSMYHGRRVPGFPQHPHRGFETVTYVRRGVIDHSDSLGAAARFGAGDTQWMTAGRGIVHSEMFPLLDAEAPNPLELFQLWLNLPAADKLVDPHFAMLWSRDTPECRPAPGVRVTVVAGALGDAAPGAPPPHSWAAAPDHDVAIWHLRWEPDAQWWLPPARSEAAARALYLFAGGPLEVADTIVAEPTALVLDARREVRLCTRDRPCEALLLQGRPIGEPVAQHGPFVMNHRPEIDQAIRDYQTTGFGGWPWERDDPTHDPARGRFARHADGRVETG